MDQIEETLKKSGLLGLTEVTSDCRYAEDNFTTMHLNQKQNVH